MKVISINVRGLNMQIENNEIERLKKNDISDRTPDDITTYGKYTVKSYFAGEEDITDLIISYIDSVVSLKF